jgi:hypothetical protein
VNTSKNIITIAPAGDDGRASADPHAAFTLFSFLVENLRPGFIVELDNSDGDQVSWTTGAKLPGSAPG